MINDELLADALIAALRLLTDIGREEYYGRSTNILDTIQNAQDCAVRLEQTKKGYIEAKERLSKCLRDDTGLPILSCLRVLEKHNLDYKEALEELKNDCKYKS